MEDLSEMTTAQLYDTLIAAATELRRRDYGATGYSLSTGAIAMGDNLLIEPQLHRIMWQGHQHKLAGREMGVVLALVDASHEYPPGLTRAELIAAAWKDSPHTNPGSATVILSRLRTKMPGLIITLHDGLHRRYTLATAPALQE